MATLQITKKLYVIPLIDVQSTTFAERYVTGVRLRLFGWREHGEVEAQGPLPAYYLIDNPKRCAQINGFDGCHEEPLRKDIGFFLGLLHGGVLTPDSTRWAIGCTVGEHFGRLFPLAKPQLCTHSALSAKQRTVLQEA